MTYFHALCSPFLILVFGFVFPLFIHVLTLLMHREEIYVQKKKHTSKDGDGEGQFVISDLYSDGNEDMVATFQIFRNTGLYSEVNFPQISKVNLHEGFARSLC